MKLFQMWYKNTVQNQFTSKSSSIESAKKKRKFLQIKSLKNYMPKFRIGITSLMLVYQKKKPKARPWRSWEKELNKIIAVKPN